MMMPTLETEEVYDVIKMQALANELSSHDCRDRIIALRIGGNDLMNVVSLRRPRDLTLYDTPMGYVIKCLCQYSLLVILRLPHQYANTSTITAFWDENSLWISPMGWWGKRPFILIRLV